MRKGGPSTSWYGCSLAALSGTYFPVRVYKFYYIREAALRMEKGLSLPLQRLLEVSGDSALQLRIMTICTTEKGVRVCVGKRERGCYVHFQKSSDDFPQKVPNTVNVRYKGHRYKGQPLIWDKTQSPDPKSPFMIQQKSGYKGQKSGYKGQN